MRIFAIPAAFLLACCFYPVLPKAAKAFELALSALYRLTLRLFTRKNGAADHQPALAMYLLALCGVSMLLSAIHPLAGIILMAPLFTGLAALPACVQMEHELDSGAYVGDIPAYEKLGGKALFVVAGAPACSEELKNAGIENFIHVRVNVLETLKDINAKL